MSSQAQINKLLNRYPFDEEELEQLIRCQSVLLDTKSDDSFLMKLAECSPYSFFFLPGDEMRKRVDFIEGRILPSGFGSSLRAAISADLFVDLSSEKQDKALERLLEGVADCGRRGLKEALRVIFDCCSAGIDKEVAPKELIGLCYRLSVAAEALVAPKMDQEAFLSRLGNSPSEALERSLLSAAGKTHMVTKKMFTEWAEASFPLLASTLSTFVHNVIFHGKPYPNRAVPYAKPELYHASDIFKSSGSPLLFSFACMSPYMGGKWHRLYSYNADGRSFNRLEWSLLGYNGPTVMVIQTDQDALLGGFCASAWKQSGSFFGDSETYIFQLEPTAQVFRPVGKDENFVYCNPKARQLGANGLPHGLGFGGTLNQPRLFIPESFEECAAGYLDTTFQTGDLLPKEALERFSIKNLEVWGVGGDEAIAKALRTREEHREVTDSSIQKARVVQDKTQFLEDINLKETKLYAHREQARGRAEFGVDEQHGGYKLDHDYVDPAKRLSTGAAKES